MSSASFSSHEDMTPSKGEGEVDPKADQDILALNLNLNPVPGMDFKRNKESSFQNTISLVTNLISEIDNRAKKLRAKKKIAAI